MPSLEQIKKDYVRRSLDRYGQRVMADMKREISRLKIKDTAALRDSLDYKVIGGHYPSGGQFHLIMLDYGPFQDMGVGRGAGLSITNADRRSRFTKRRPRKFYSPVAYGRLNSLLSMLQFGLTEDTIATIREELR